MKSDPWRGWKGWTMMVLQLLIAAVVGVAAYRSDGLLPFLAAGAMYLFVALIIWRERRRQF